MPKHLSAAQVSQFREAGYVFPLRENVSPPPSTSGGRVIREAKIKAE